MRIVINADDFGYSADTVRATIDCFERGIVTSASIMPRMPATSAALQFAAAHPELSFGVHLTFVGDGTERPVADASEVEHLVDDDGRFLPTNRVRVRALTRRLPMRELEREVAAQIDAVRGRRRPSLTSTRIDTCTSTGRFALRSSGSCLGTASVASEPCRMSTFAVPGDPRRSGSGRPGGTSCGALFVTTDHFYMGTSAGDRTGKVSAPSSRPSRRTVRWRSACIPATRNRGERRSGLRSPTSWRPSTEHTLSSAGQTSECRRSRTPSASDSLPWASSR